MAEKKFTNQKYELVVQSPLLRPGLKLRVKGFSGKYAVDVMQQTMEIVREFNRPEQDKPKSL